MTLSRLTYVGSRLLFVILAFLYGLIFHQLGLSFPQQLGVAAFPVMAFLLGVVREPRW